MAALLSHISVQLHDTRNDDGAFLCLSYLLSKVGRAWPRKEVFWFGEDRTGQLDCDSTSVDSSSTH